MKTIAIVNAKGGCGRTTTAMYLATALTHSSPGLKGVVIDGDPNGTATEWALRAEEDGTPLPFDVDTANRSNLERKIRSYDWAVIDTARDGSKGFADAALALADVAIIPTRTTFPDMERMWVTERMASRHGKAIVLIAQSPTPNTTDRRAAFSALDSHNVSRFETFIPLSTDIGRAMGTVPGPEMHNYDEVFEELEEAMRWGKTDSTTTSEPVADLSDFPGSEIDTTNKAISGGTLEKRTQLTFAVDQKIRDRLASAARAMGKTQRDFVVEAVEAMLMKQADAITKYYKDQAAAAAKYLAELDE